jgi:hypothetical protein
VLESSLSFASSELSELSEPSFFEIFASFLLSILSGGNFGFAIGLASLESSSILFRGFLLVCCAESRLFGLFFFKSSLSLSLETRFALAIFIFVSCFIVELNLFESSSEESLFSTIFAGLNKFNFNFFIAQKI